MELFLESMHARQYSRLTIRTYYHNLCYFLRWVEELGLSAPEQVTVRTLESYRRYLSRYRKRFKNGRELTLSRNTQSRYLSTLRTWFLWLVRQGYLIHNPAQHLELPRQVSRLPDILSREEVARVLAQPLIEHPYGLRDRAFLELLYATGMRRAEIMHLRADDIDFPRAVLLIRQGKGGKDRVVPTGERALNWVQRYIEESRPVLARVRDGGALFLTRSGESFEGSLVALLIKKYFAAAGISKQGSCHLFRHACATHMLEGGADIRYVQEMLGHASLTTTQIYTRVSIAALREVHARSHPSASLPQVPTGTGQNDDPDAGS